MKKSLRFVFSVLLLGAFLLSACSGATPQQYVSSQGSAASQGTEAGFIGTVESMDDAQWTISGQLVSVDGSTTIDPSVQVGDIVKVEAAVSQDGVVLALKIELSGPDDNANDNMNDDNSNGNSNSNSNSNSNDNDDDSNSNSKSN